jgi:hypothetical protein
MDLTFDKFEYQKNLSQQRELFKDCFPETNGDMIQSTDHYLWKFHAFPNDVHSWEYSANLGGEMVGYYAAIPYRYKIGDVESNVGMVCDVMTSTKQRGKGIFTKIGLFSTMDLANHVPFTIGYPIRKEVIPGHLKVGWKIAFPMPLYIKFLKTDSLLKSKKIGFLSFVANPFLKMYNYFRSTSITGKYGSSIFEEIDKVKGYKNFSEEWGKTVRNSLVKDIDFMRWRFSAPNRFYKFLIITSEDKLVGLVTFRKIVKEGVLSYGIIDYMILPGYEDCHGFINNVLKNEASKENVECLLCMMSKSSAKKNKLNENGFLKSPFTFQLIIKNLTFRFTDKELYNEENWHLMWIDSDDL